MKYKNKNTKKSKIKLLSFLLVASLLISLSGLLYLRTRANTSANNQSSEVISGDSESKINYNPPTEDEQEAGDDIKPDIGSGTNTPNNASVVIVDAGKYDNNVEVRAFVSNSVKAGSCKFEFTKNSNIVTREVKAAPDASTTQCESISIPYEEFGNSGTWKLTVTYTANNLTGKAEQDVQIQ